MEKTGEPRTYRLRASRYMRRANSKGSTRFSRFSRVSRVSRVSRYSVHAAVVLRPEDFHIRKSLADCVRAELDARNRALFHQRVCIVAKNRLPPPDAEADGGASPEQRYRDLLAERMVAIHQHCYKETFTTDQLHALSVCMGDYTLLLLEGADDMVGEFCIELAAVAEQLWTNNRVFFVEDRIGDMYFKSLVLRHCSPININEKFAAATPNDEFLMAAQHWLIMERVRLLCTKLAAEVNVDDDVSLPLPADRYNKLLPEVQRLDLVLNSARFYRSVQSYAKIYWRIPQHQDEDALLWPVPFGYAPLGIFERSPYDVNLTFADYGGDLANKGNDTGGVEHSSVADEPADGQRASAKNAA